MCKLTVFTATYNRGHIIENLYRSLQRQRNFDFEWLVVDDGSEDNTQELFGEWLKEDNNFKIRYYRQKNQGLIRALNRGVELAYGEYFAKIDSDDFVVDDYIDNMMKWIDGIQDCEDVYAVSGLRVTPDGMPLKGVWPEVPADIGFMDATDLERAKYNLDADMSEAWSTEVLRNHPFPVWKGEKFAPEQLVLYQIALEGLKIRWYSIPMCVCEYQDGGLTLGADKLVKQNPMGYAMMYNQYMIIDTDFKRRFFDAAQMTALCFCAGHLEYLAKSNNKFMTALSFPFGITLGLRRKRQFKKISN